ncbi:hypothetical protein [Actinotalea fermentans]|uniref:DUF4386 family protein n=1 Tax=Actinotalea fermentans TaxID=43671 RepID=A0A511YYS4_9CELL|nr:hypothetical protein [Actinotalea fermentans]KGM15666.1 hypothetical protein N867_06570 [Actinotalea fermentans ATCC 43279 = JCM 9966 = DSM 3133]GEN80350.1 hypothetical protein AFE02nite_20840 [Actinotalea fermentans]
MNLSVSRSLGATALLLAALVFAAYPALRPYTDETTLDGARAFASGAWAAAHTAGMVGFVVLPVGLLGLAAHVAPGRGRAAVVLAWLGGALVLPYYGAETFGLDVIGARAAADGDTGLLSLAEEFRTGALPVTTFGLGLLLLAGAGVALAATTWRTPARWGGTFVGTALVLYLPQFFAPPAARIAHGALLGVGCALLAATLLRRSAAPQA